MTRTNSAEAAGTDREGRTRFIRNPFDVICTAIAGRNKTQIVESTGGESQATGGGRFWMGAKAGLSKAATGKLEGATKRRKPDDGWAKAGGGSAATAEMME